MIDQTFRGLCARAGISLDYTDETGQHHAAGEETAAAILGAMGFDTNTARARQEAIDEFDARKEVRKLPEWLIIKPDTDHALPLDPSDRWQLLLEDGTEREGQGSLLPRLPLGLHRFVTGRHETTVICAPSELPLPRAGWGINVPLAGLYAAKATGIGSYQDLEEVGKIFAEEGAAFIGCNPIHAGFPLDPKAFSPYSPSHRRRFNVQHVTVPIDIAEPDCPAAGLIDFTCEIPLKRKCLRQGFESLSQDRLNRFEDWLGQTDESLLAFALHQSLSEIHGPYWPDWPQHLQRYSRKLLDSYRQELDTEIRFHAWLQHEAERQLSTAHDAVRQGGMRHGLYLDLAVGTHPYGAETWLEPQLFAQGVSLGAPPDALGPEGQRWGLVPFNPFALINDGFASFAETLRSQLRYAGILRIDHILGFNRAFWVPDGSDMPGAYVAMPQEALLAITRMEAARADAVIIGEDLGNIPGGLRDALEASGILGCRLVMFEKDPDENAFFRRPDDYPERVMTSFTTHDLPTWSGWRQAVDLDFRKAQQTITEEEFGRFSEARNKARSAIDEALGDNSGSASAIHRFIAKSRSRLVMLPIEDILEVQDQPNVPGTITEYPNWRHRLPVSIAELREDGRVEKTGAIMKSEGR